LLLPVAALGLTGLGSPSVHGGTPVSIAVVEKAAIGDDLALVGSAIPRRMSQISAQVDGLVEEFYVEEGQAVDAGDPLFRLDDRLARIAVTRAEAEVAEARARLEDAERRLGEAASLLPERAIPESVYESTRIEAEVARAAVMRLEADLARQEELQRRHRVVAPFDGVIVSRGAEVGQWIRTDSSVVGLAEVDRLRIEVPVPQQRFPEVSIGQQASIRFDAMPNRTFTGTVGRKIPSSRDQVRTFPVWIDFENSEGMVAPGMSARVSLNLSDSDQRSLVVPNDAIVRRADGSVLIWLVRDDGGQLLATPASVQVGRVNGALVEVSGADVRAGDWVVVRGNETLRPRQPVRAVGPSGMDS
jgi:RND family efflux transporter MFP subunit